MLPLLHRRLSIGLRTQRAFGRNPDPRIADAGR